MKQGSHHSIEARMKMSITRKGSKRKPHTIETRLKISQSRKGCPPTFLGRRHSEETKIAISKALVGRKPSRGFTGGSHSEETRRLFVEQRLGKHCHTNESKAKIAASNSRRKWKEESKIKVAESVAKFWSTYPHPRSSLEIALARLLTIAEFTYIEQYSIGRYIVDAFIPSHNIAFEADGSYWHRDKENDKNRDLYLLSKGIAAIIHLDESDLESFEYKKFHNHNRNKDAIRDEIILREYSIPIIRIKVGTLKNRALETILGSPIPNS